MLMKLRNKKTDLGVSNVYVNNFGDLVIRHGDEKKRIRSCRDAKTHMLQAIEAYKNLKAWVPNPENTKEYILIEGPEVRYWKEAGKFINILFSKDKLKKTSHATNHKAGKVA